MEADDMDNENEIDDETIDSKYEVDGMVFDCCSTYAGPDFSQINFKEFNLCWLSHIDCCDWNLWQAVAVILLAPAVLLLYEKSQTDPCYPKLVEAFSFIMNFYKFYKMRQTVLGQPMWSALQDNWVLLFGYMLFFVGVIFLASCVCRFGAWDTFVRIDFKHSKRDIVARVLTPAYQRKFQDLTVVFKSGCIFLLAGYSFILSFTPAGLGDSNYMGTRMFMLQIFFYQCLVLVTVITGGYCQRLTDSQKMVVGVLVGLLSLIVLVLAVVLALCCCIIQQKSSRRLKTRQEARHTDASSRRSQVGPVGEEEDGVEGEAAIQQIQTPQEQYSNCSGPATRNTTESSDFLNHALLDTWPDESASMWSSPPSYRSLENPSPPGQTPSRITQLGVASAEIDGAQAAVDDMHSQLRHLNLMFLNGQLSQQQYCQHLFNLQTREQQTCEQQTCEQQTREQQTCEQQTCEQQTCEQQTCEQQTREQQTCEQQTHEQQTHEQQTREQQSHCFAEDMDEQQMKNLQMNYQQCSQQGQQQYLPELTAGRSPLSLTTAQQYQQKLVALLQANQISQEQYQVYLLNTLENGEIRVWRNQQLSQEEKQSQSMPQNDLQDMASGHWDNQQSHQRSLQQQPQEASEKWIEEKKSTQQQYDGESQSEQGHSGPNLKKNKKLRKQKQQVYLPQFAGQLAGGRRQLESRRQRAQSVGPQEEACAASQLKPSKEEKKQIFPAFIEKRDYSNVFANEKHNLQDKMISNMHNSTDSAFNIYEPRSASCDDSFSDANVDMGIDCQLNVNLHNDSTGSENDAMAEMQSGELNSQLKMKVVAWQEPDTAAGPRAPANLTTPSVASERMYGEQPDSCLDLGAKMKLNSDKKRKKKKKRMLKKQPEDV